MKNLHIALAGNPNSGKTSIFNSITGANQKVGNWGGVTVDIKTGYTTQKEYRLKITDMPGTYSLTAYSMEELVTRDFLIDGDSNLVVDVLDATNLERNLYLAVQLMEMGKPLVFAFNMSDELAKQRVTIDKERLSKLLGVPIQFTIGRTEKGISELLDRIIDVAEGKSLLKQHVVPHYGEEIENELALLVKQIEGMKFKRKGIPTRWYAIKLLEADSKMVEFFGNLPDSQNLRNQLEKSIHHIREIYQEEPGTIISEQRYGFINGALSEAVSREPMDRISLSEKIDALVTNRFLAYPIFALFMWILFQLTFTLGHYPMLWIEALLNFIKELVVTQLPASQLKELLTEGIIGGVGNVLVFLPNILILFMGISLLEDSGYMARIAFIMDKIMHKLGLHGKSFIPLIMGTGCSVPAIMAARTLESPKDRILTVLITPLITCSARLPVYILFTGAFFPNQAGNIIFLLYFSSFLFAFGIGLLFRKTLFRGEAYPFVIELPPYRIPTTRSIFIHMWEKSKHYLQKMGGVILAFSIIMWFFSNFPQDQRVSAQYDTQIQTLQSRMPGIKDAKTAEQTLSRIQELEHHKQLTKIKNTLIGRIGQVIEPFIRPLGFDWRMGISLFTGFVAKEAIVSTIGVLFFTGQENNDLTAELQQQLKKNYTPLQGIAFLFFVLLYTPCIVSIVTLFKELKSWKWTLFSVLYQLSLAWVVAFSIFNLGRLFGFG